MKLQQAGFLILGGRKIVYRCVHDLRIYSSQAKAVVSVGAPKL
jgi:hypothetical protein